MSGVLSIGLIGLHGEISGGFLDSLRLREGRFLGPFVKNYLTRGGYRCGGVGGGDMISVTIGDLCW